VSTFISQKLQKKGHYFLKITYSKMYHSQPSTAVTDRGSNKMVWSIKAATQVDEIKWKIYQVPHIYDKLFATATSSNERKWLQRRQQRSL